MARVCPAAHTQDHFALVGVQQTPHQTCRLDFQQSRELLFGLFGVDKRKTNWLLILFHNFELRHRDNCLWIADSLDDLGFESKFRRGSQAASILPDFSFSGEDLISGGFAGTGRTDDGDALPGGGVKRSLKAIFSRGKSRQIDQVDQQISCCRAWRLMTEQNFRLFEKERAFGFQG